MDIKTIMEFGIDEKNAEKLFQEIESYILNQIETKEKEFDGGYSQKIEKIKLEYYIEKELALSGAKNILAVKALIDFSNMDKIDEELIKNMIKELRNSPETKFLFYEKEGKETKETFKGFTPIERKTKKTTKKNMNYEELCSFYENSKI